MTYTYQGNGTITTHGHARTSKKIYISYKWGENSILFVKSKALKGCLEKVCIKSAIINSNAKTFNQVAIIYKDTLNSLWNESDLIEEEEAKSLALAYWKIMEELYQQQEFS
jgi:hypothetical protein